MRLPRDLLRGLFAFALLAAVLGMHAMTPPAGHAPAPSVQAMTHSVQAMTGVVSNVGQPALSRAGSIVSPDHGGAGSTERPSHAAVHLCLAVLAAVALAVAVAVAVKVAQSRADNAVAPLMAVVRAEWGRAPPWTTPSLTQLSVLRV